MNNENIIKLEFTQAYQTQNFHVNNLIHEKLFKTKIAGKSNNVFFSSKLKFVLTSDNNKIYINNLQFNNIKYFGPINSSNNSNSNSNDILSKSHIDDDLTKNIYNEIASIFNNAFIYKNNKNITVTLKLQSSLIDNMCINIFNTDSSSSIVISDLLSSSSKSIIPPLKSFNSPTNIQTNYKNKSSKSSDSSDSSEDSFKNKLMKKIIQLLGWSSVMIFVIFFLKNNFNPFSFFTYKKCNLESIIDTITNDDTITNNDNTVTNENDTLNDIKNEILDVDNNIQQETVDVDTNIQQETVDVEIVQETVDVEIVQETVDVETNIINKIDIIIENNDNLQNNENIENVENDN